MSAKSKIDNKSAGSVLEQTRGYAEAMQVKAELEASGSDFRDRRGDVRRRVAGLHPKRLQLRVAEIREDTPSTKTLRMVAQNGQSLPPFQAGQYVNLFVNINGIRTARPYAISSSPSELGYYDLTVKKLPTGFVSIYLVDEVVVDQEFETTGPMGTFHYNPLFHGSELVFLAGGSGIAPAISMIKSVIDFDRSLNFHFLYCNSFETDVIFADELRELAARHANFRLTEIVSRPTTDQYTGHQGYLSLELMQSELLQAAPDIQLTERMYYICGPTPFNDHCLDLLGQLNVKSRRILVEGNGPPREPAQLPDWPAGVSADEIIEIRVRGQDGQSRSFRAPAGEPLLNSLERNGYGTENACRSGECSLCRVKLRSGKVYSPPESLIRKSDRGFGWIHSCVAFPVSDVEVQL